MGLLQPTKMGKMGHLWGDATHLSEKWEIATHLAFSCLFLDPPTQGRVVVNAGANISPQLLVPWLWGAVVSFFASKQKTATRGDNGLHEDCIFAFGKDVLSWNSSAAYITGFLAPKRI